MYQDPNDYTRNRGFAFIVFDCHQDAAVTRRAMINSEFTLWGQTCTVNWAEPENNVDERIMATVSISCNVLYSGSRV